MQKTKIEKPQVLTKNKIQLFLATFSKNFDLLPRYDNTILIQQTLFRS